MNKKLLPKKLCNNVLNKISPMMNEMEGAPEVRSDHNIVIDENFIEQ